ncbi:Ribosome biogenesis protein nsa2 like [Verticillium longisporum]|nr:Ribosome biogenesis protein nsa2 like [Verticillium longisporum]
MHFTTVLSTLGLMASIALAAPKAPILAARDEDVDFTVYKDDAGNVESFVNATALGIDINWDEVTEEQLQKRQGWANIGIGMWAQDNCQGQASYFDNVQYNVNHYGTINHYSFGIRYRGLRNGEQLDVSRLNGGDWCGTYVATIARNSGTGCGHVGPINCFPPIRQDASERVHGGKFSSPADRAPPGSTADRFNERQSRTRRLTLDHEERTRKKLAREGHKQSKDAQNLRGLKAKLRAEDRRKEKIQMRKKIKAHEERDVKTTNDEEPSEPMPAYLLDRKNPNMAKAISSQIKNKRAEKSARFAVPLPKVRGIAEEEMFKVVSTGKKTHQKSWKRMITKPTFVGENFTRRDPKHERFIRPMGLRYKKAHVTHRELGVTALLPIISVKKNPNSPMYTNLGVLTKGTIIEINVSELGMTTAGGKVVWGRYAQVMNTPENDGCVNAVLLT